MRLRRRLGGLAGGLVASVLPLVTHAAEEGGRALEPAEGFSTAMLATLGAVIALLLTWTLGYLYRRQRGLDWDFQRPDEASHH